MREGEREGGREKGGREKSNKKPCFSFRSMDFSASNEALFPSSSLLARPLL